MYNVYVPCFLGTCAFCRKRNAFREFPESAPFSRLSRFLETLGKRCAFCSRCNFNLLCLALTASN